MLSILLSEKKKFDILLLTANKSYLSLLKQAKKFNVKNLIITDFDSYNLAKKINKNPKIKIYNNFYHLNKIFSKKIDYTMSSITGLAGLEPTINLIKHTKKIAIANKSPLFVDGN